MGEEALVHKSEPSSFVNHESEAQCPSAFGHEEFIVRALFQASSEDPLNQGNSSLLQRIGRLDNILSAMEDMSPSEPSSNSFRSSHGSKRISLTPSSLEKRCKSAEAVLEEVEEKGTLVERVSELEKRLTKLHRTIITKSSENVAYPGLVEGTNSVHSIPSHDEALSHHNEHEQSMQEDVDVEKHEVTPISSAPLEHEHHCEPPFIYSEKLDISPQKKKPSVHMEGQQGMVSSEVASMEEEDRRARRQHSKNKSQRIKSWLSKRLHLGSSTRQGKHICSTGHCWSSRKNPKSCWNLKRGDLHDASSDYAHYAHHSIDEDSP